MPRYEISPKLFQVRFYDRHPDKYSACFQMFVDGERGFIYSLIGDGFYLMFPPMLPGIMKDCGVTSIEASTAKTHYEYMKKKLANIATVEIVGNTIVANRDMVWIKIMLV